METIVSVKKLTKHYGDIQAVKGIEFEVERGSFFAFLGPNGAGKSTTVNMLVTLLAQSGGEASVCGYELGKEDDGIRRNIGVVFQTSHLDGLLSVKENILLRARMYGMNKKDAVKQLEHLAKKLGIDDLLGRKYQNLSGGQKRRVDLAKALMHHPQILFLDEPTTGLDPQSRAHVWEAIQTLRQEKGTTIFLTTHYLDEADQADQVAIIDNGTIIAHDTPMNLKATYAKTALYLRLKPEVSEQLLANYRPKRVSDRYYMIMKDCFEAFRVVHELQNVIADFEIKQGTMDEVFIALTGKEIREDGHR